MQHVSIHFIKLSIKVNGRYYRDVLLMRELLPDICQLSEFYVFQQDSALMHRARETVDLFTKETPDFIRPTLWPPNSPDVNPVDYKVWLVLGNAGGVQETDQGCRQTACAYPDTMGRTWPACYWYGSQTVAHQSACMSRRKADTLNTNLATSFRPLLVGCSYFVLVNDFNVWQHLLLIFVAVSVIELIFAQQCFIWFVQLFTLKEWWSFWHLLMCHRLLTFMYKNRHFVPIYSKVIPQ